MHDLVLHEDVDGANGDDNRNIHSRIPSLRPSNPALHD